MGPMEVAALVLGGVGKAAELAAEAIKASREGDDARALALLDEALDHLDANLPNTRANLEAARARVKQKQAERFVEQV